MEAKANHRYAKQSARKLRQVADLIRGVDMERALNILHFSNKKASAIIEKVVRSAVANLINSEEGSGVEPEDLYVKAISVDDGPIAKRFRPRAMGRATVIRKRTSHINVEIASK